MTDTLRPGFSVAKSSRSAAPPARAEIKAYCDAGLPQQLLGLQP
jgi:hypothetical protein